MSTYQRTARIVGAFFLIAMVTSLAGGIWLESILAVPDYLATVSAKGSQVLLGVLLELINCLAVVGIAAALFPLMSQHDGALAAGYLGIRVAEAIVLAVAAVITRGIAPSVSRHCRLTLPRPVLDLALCHNGYGLFRSAWAITFSAFVTDVDLLAICAHTWHRVSI